MWTCNVCEAKEADMKAVIDSMGMIKNELCNLKKGQAVLQTDRVEQQAERAKVMEGLKAVEVVAKRMERIEEVQERQEERLSATEVAVKKNTKKGEEGERRTRKLEERFEKMDENAVDMRQCNAVAREVREMEKREKKIVIFNVPEPTDAEDEGQKCFEQVEAIFKELGFEDLRPTAAGRIGKAGRYPRKILASLQSRDLCEKVVRKSRDGPALTDNVFINYDRTFNQRQEAKLFRLEREEEEKEPHQSERGRGRGKARGRPRGRGNFGRGGGGGDRGGGSRGRGGGRGGRGNHTDDSESRKRRPSAESSDDVEDEAKRRKTGMGNEKEVALPPKTQNQTPVMPNNLEPAVNRQGDGEQGAEGGAEVEGSF